MDLLVLIIQQIVKALKQPAQSRMDPTTTGPNDLVRQIQARIEAARMKGPASTARVQTPAKARAKIPGFKLRKGKRKGPPVLAPAVIAAPAPRSKPAAEVVRPAPAKPAVASVDAKQLAGWLRPQTLRSQFILTEIFQPPIALRDTHLN